MELSNMYFGFKNLIFKDEKIEIEAEKRLKICFECPFRKVSKCSVCGCYLQAKTRGENSKCPKQKW